MLEHPDALPRDDEGGLHAPPELHGWRKWWWWFDFIILVKLARLRFIAILVAIGAVITQWDKLVAHYEKWTRPPHAESAASSEFEWFCPMHPTIIRDNPKEKCPICFMALSKRKKGSGVPEVLPAGVVNRVQLSPYRVALAGVRTWSVDYQPLTKQFTAVGFIEFNERGQKTVSARIAGRIDDLQVSETGRMVNAGDELAALYSPELLVSIESLLEAKKSGDRMLLNASRQRLELLGIGGDQIDAWLKGSKPETGIPIRSPISGHVIKKYVRAGQYVSEGMPLYDVADLTSVWIQAQVYEDDLAFLPAKHEEMTEEPLPVIATTRSVPDQTFHGTLSFIFPHADQSSRTVTVRFEVDNPDCKLKPGSTAAVTFNVPLRRLDLFANLAKRDATTRENLDEGRVLAVPESAVIDTGSQKIVYREDSPGVYEGTLVRLGPRLSGPDGVAFFPVLDGLERGNRVVAGGSFLVDAETRLNPAAGSIYFGGSGAKSGPTATVRPSTPDDPEAKVQAALAKLSADDRKLVAEQRYCPVLDESRLGVMGTPVKVVIENQPVFLCCDTCRQKALAGGNATLERAEQLKQGKPPATERKATDAESQRIAAALAKLSPADRQLAEKQGFCVVNGENRLGVMGVPVKVSIEGQPVFLCCESCQDEALANPKQTLSKLKALRN